MAKKGSLSITRWKYFPCDQKWLYSDHDIFYRELISNGCDAITKLKKLELMGEYEKPEEDWVQDPGQCKILQDKTITIEDNGLGMTEEEIDRYINQIAFSGVQDFMEKLQRGKANEGSDHRSLRSWFLFCIYGSWQGWGSIPCLTRKMQSQYTGSLKAASTLRWPEGDKAESWLTSIKLYLNEEKHWICKMNTEQERSSKILRIYACKHFL